MNKADLVFIAGLPAEICPLWEFSSTNCKKKNENKKSHAEDVSCEKTLYFASCSYNLLHARISHRGHSIHETYLQD